MKFRKDPKYLHWGITALAVIILSIILYVIFTNLPGFFETVKSFLTILSPVIYGLCIAFILNPIMVFIEKHILPFFRKRKISEQAARSISRTISVVVSILIGLAVVYGFFALLLPNLIESVRGIIGNMQQYSETVQGWLDTFTADYPQYSDYVEKVIEGVEGWIQTNVLANLPNLVVTATSQAYLVLKGTANILIGLVAAIYMLSSKEKFQAQSKKIIVAVMKRDKADHFFEVMSQANRIFSGFISGKLIDSLIIGVLCYIGMAILRLPYPELISTIVGVTNVIPFFGPIIGAIPSGLLILLVNPMQALYFLIFVFGLQQLDGNLIGPYILGDAVGLPSFWILVSITIFGGMFGFVGMLLGVPVFAVLYMLIRETVNQKLAEKGAPVCTSYYYHMTRTSDLEAVGDADDDPKKEPKPEQKPDPDVISEDEMAEAEREFWK